jgi:hypothetical protein
MIHVKPVLTTVAVLTSVALGVPLKDAGPRVVQRDGATVKTCLTDYGVFPSGGFTSCGYNEEKLLAFGMPYVSMTEAVWKRYLGPGGANGNPLCGKHITMTHTGTGQTVMGVVVDRKLVGPQFNARAHAHCSYLRRQRP